MAHHEISPRDETHAPVSVVTAVCTALVSLSLVPGIAGDDGFPRAFATSLLVLIGRGLYLLFRHAP
jgi:hypothetical protein